MDENAGERSVEIPGSMAGQRLDRALHELFPEYSRSFLEDLIEAGQVAVDGVTPAKVKPALRLPEGTALRISFPAPSTGLAPWHDARIGLLFEDEHIAVFDKPAGMPTHPQRMDSRDTLANVLIARYGTGLPYADDERLAPGIVHRLDAGTTGVIICARTRLALDELKRQFREREVRKTYLAVVEGKPRGAEFAVEVPIERDPQRPHAMRLNHQTGRPARTEFKVLERFDKAGAQGFALIEAHPVTGRTHQVRVHLAARELPIVADPLYGSPGTLSTGDVARRADPLSVAPMTAPQRGKPLIARQALHAQIVTISHPSGGQSLTFEAPLPADMRALLAALREAAPPRSVSHGGAML